eukprot:366546-Chlamydomonas_euryale.AAC.18
MQRASKRAVLDCWVQGFLAVRGTGYRKERRGHPLPNVFRQWCDARELPCVVIEQVRGACSGRRSSSPSPCPLIRPFGAYDGVGQRMGHTNLGDRTGQRFGHHPCPNSGSRPCVGWRLGQPTT